MCYELEKTMGWIVKMGTEPSERNTSYMFLRNGIHSRKIYMNCMKDGAKMYPVMTGIDLWYYQCTLHKNHTEPM